MISRFLVASRNISLCKSLTSSTLRQLQSRNYHVISNAPGTVCWDKRSSCEQRNVQNHRLALSLRSSRNFSASGTLRNAQITAPVATTAIASEATTAEIPQIPEIPAIPTTPAEEFIVTTVNGEPTFASLGLGGNWPSGLLQQCMEFLHITCDLPWWGAIATATVIMRLLLTPFIIVAQRNSAKMNNALPEMQRIQLKMTEARQMGNAMETAQYSQELVQLMRTKGVSPLKNMIAPVAQLPVFLSFFIGIRGMVNAPVESLRTGGLWWFEDLTLADPYLILPAVTCLTLLLTVELSVSSQAMATSSNAHIMKYVLRAMPVVVFPFIMNFPTALVCYWTVSNFISLIQTYVLKIPKVRTFFNIDPLVKHDKGKLPIKDKKFIEGVKDSWSNMKLTRELEGRRRLDEVNFNRAAQNALVRTYKYDPTKPRDLSAKKV